MSHDRQHRSSSCSFDSKGVVQFVFQTPGRPSLRDVSIAWLMHREHNYQTVRLDGDGQVAEHGPVTIMTFTSRYGPVKGNRQSDHHNKAARVAELLGGIEGRLVPGSFEREEHRTQ